jgi:hypothetical protein
MLLEIFFLGLGGLLQGPFAFFATYLGVSVLRSTIAPLYNSWLTRSAPAEVRATVISMSGQMDALGQVASGPVIGVVGLLRSVRAALVLAGVLLSPAVVLYTRALRQESLVPAVESATMKGEPTIDLKILL